MQKHGHLMTCLHYKAEFFENAMKIWEISVYNEGEVGTQ